MSIFFSPDLCPILHQILKKLDVLTKIKYWTY